MGCPVSGGWGSWCSVKGRVPALPAGRGPGAGAAAVALRHRGMTVTPLHPTPQGGRGWGWVHQCWQGWAVLIVLWSGDWVPALPAGRGPGAGAAAVALRHRGMTVTPLHPSPQGLG
jgi:NADPH-dependent 2,4-dienoyl-CoA reductase/sulfur reductase-like enzyme